MELIDGLEPPDVSACTGLETALSAQQSTPGNQAEPAAAAGSPPHAEHGVMGPKDFTRSSRNQPFLDQHMEQHYQEQQEQQQQHQQQEQQQQEQMQQAQPEEPAGQQNPAGSTLFSMASCDGGTYHPASQYDSIRRATSAAYPVSYSPSRLSIGAASGFARHSAAEIFHHSAPPSAAAPVRQTSSAHNLAHRAASLPTNVLRSTGKLQHHHQSLRSPFENASEGSGAPSAVALCTLMHEIASGCVRS